MPAITRRDWLRAAAVPAFPFLGLGATRPTDVRMEDMRFSYEDFHYRTPIKFGGTVLDRVTLLNVDCVVRTPGGKTAKGFGSMPLGNVWSFPSKTMGYDVTLGAMKALADRVAVIARG